MRAIQERCDDLLSRLTATETCSWHREELPQIAHKLLYMEDFVRYNVLPSMVERRFVQLEEQASTEERALFYKCILLTSIRELCTELSSNTVMLTTQEVKELYEGWFQRVLEECEGGEVEAYTKSNDKMIKDLAICTGNMYPAGAQIVEVTGIGKRTFLQGDRLSKAKGLMYLMGALKFQTTHFYQIHTDDRYLHEFKPEGWYRCYLRIAEMLRLHPSIQGVWGASWFFDPQIQYVSPHLGYLYLRPYENGATFFKQESSESDIINATSTSRSRRKKMEAGEYTPTGYAMIWLRQDLLRWAEAQEPERPMYAQAA